MNTTVSETIDSGNETLFSDDSSTYCDATDSSPTNSSLAGSVSNRLAATEASLLNTNGLPKPDTGAAQYASPRTGLFADQTRSGSMSNVQPPKIQPYSGVLGKGDILNAQRLIHFSKPLINHQYSTEKLTGKVAIRPIAFRPTEMSPACRLANAGERYGSTPILSRAGSHLALYGSTNDLNSHQNQANRSLDRKLLLSRTSTSPSTSPIGMMSLPSLSHRNRFNYDSLENVNSRKSPNYNSLNRNKLSTFSLMSGVGCSMIDLTPSPSDSGVSDLEAALRDRDSEVAYLRQTMEHNEQVIFRVYQEKERMWERDLRRMKAMHENRLRACAQKSHKLEQMLMMQTYQAQQEKKRLRNESEKLQEDLTQVRGDLEAARLRLEEIEWVMCEKTGEISLLKTQLKDAQVENGNRNHELSQVRNELRDVRENVERKDNDKLTLHQIAEEKDLEIKTLKEKIKQLKEQLKESDGMKLKEQHKIETDKLKVEIKELREELSEVAMSEYEGIEDGRSLRSGGIHNHQNSVVSNSSDKSIDENDIEVEKFTNIIEDNVTNELLQQAKHHEPNCPEFYALLEKMNDKMQKFNRERITWAEEKEKVLKYQRQLQLNYVQMFRKTRALENEVEALTLELQLCLKSKPNHKLSTSEQNTTIEL